MVNVALEAARVLLAVAAQRDAAEIPLDASILNLQSWDSLAHLRLVIALEESLGRELAPDDIVNISTLEDVARHLQQNKK